MKTVVIALFSTVAVALLAAPASAQSPNREAAIKQCTARVAAVVGMEEKDQNARVAAYKACMTKLGQRP